MNIFRKPVLAVADRSEVQDFVRNRKMTQGLVRRFIAGEDLETALSVAAKLSRLGITATLDELGENVSTAEEASGASQTYIATLKRMSEAGIEPNISIKLTMLGLDLGVQIAIDNTLPILTCAKTVSGFVRIDMEGSAYTGRTMSIFESLHDQYPTEVGIVIQTYLHRARADVEKMIERRARVRLVKGAYAEPATVAYQNRDEIDDNYRRLTELLLQGGNYPAIATHDPALIAATLAYATSNAITADRFELQMLYGVRRDEQTNLISEGCRVRVYVPYGTEWYPYFTRRIAERPANALFVLRQLISR